MSDYLAEILAEFDSRLPLARARTIPAPWYTSPEVAGAERDRIFSRNWLIVGLAEQVSKPGQFLTAEIAGMPLLVVRDQAGVLRAFFNVCRHRAALVMTEPCGHTTRLRCRYHGWTYDLAGQLRGTPEFDGVEDFHRDQNGLQELTVATWGPWVAVHAGQPKISFAEWLDPLPARAESGMASLVFVNRREYTLQCNWKVYVDNYLDGGYHVNSIHPALAGMLDYTQYRIETFGRSSVQTSPLTTDGGSVRRGQAQYWYVFPNFMMNLYDGLMDTNTVLPLGPDRCRVIFDFYFATSGPPADPTFREQSLAVADRIQLEDLAICEDVQRGLASGAYKPGRYSVRREIAGHHFHCLLGQCLQAGV